jgi:hypothetical protein
MLPVILFVWLGIVMPKIPEYLRETREKVDEKAAGGNTTV